MKRSKTFVDHLGIQALANVYPELGRIIFLSTNTGKVVLHHFMNSDDPSMKLITADDIISRAAVKAAILAGITFIKFIPGIGENELGGHFDNLDVLPDHKDDDKSMSVNNNESQQGEAESQDDCFSPKSAAEEAEARRCMIDINRWAGELIAQMTAAHDHDQKKFLELDEKATQLLMKLDNLELLTIPDLLDMRKDVVSRLQKCSTDNEHRLSSESSESSSSESSDTANSVLSSVEDSTEDDGGESGEENDGGESGEDCEKVDGAGSGSGDIAIAEVTACIIFHLCRSSLPFCSDSHLLRSIKNITISLIDLIFFDFKSKLTEIHGAPIPSSLMALLSIPLFQPLLGDWTSLILPTTLSLSFHFNISPSCQGLQGRRW